MLQLAQRNLENRTGVINCPAAPVRPRPGHATVHHHWGIRPLRLEIAPRKTLYEEFHPYGTSAYRAFQSSEVSAKRYRYTGKEKDEETKLYYYGARYLAPWLGRWMSPDPKGLVDGPGLYNYVRGSPVVLSDPSGTDAKKLVNKFEPITQQIAICEAPAAPEPAQAEGAAPQELRVTPHKDEPGSWSTSSSSTEPPGPTQSAPASAGGPPEISHVPDKPEPPSAEVEDPNIYLTTMGLIRDFEAKGEALAKQAEAEGGVGQETNPRYRAWDLAREEYRQVNLTGGDRALRNAEHYLLRRLVASQEEAIDVPNALPFAEPGPLNPELPLPRGLVQLNDVFYNLLRPIGEKFLDITPTTPEMEEFEEMGYQAGDRLRGQRRELW